MPVGYKYPVPRTLAIDVGSSSVKAAVVDGGRLVSTVKTEPFRKLRAVSIEWAVRHAVGRLTLNRIDRVALTTFSPSWLAMDEGGEALSEVFRHDDTRSLEQAKRIERTVGRERHLALAGNRPTPGGISSTSAAWFIVEWPELAAKVHRVGHLPTYLIHRWTGSWVADPSNACFMGLMDVTTGDWSDELCAVAGMKRDWLPPIVDAAEVMGSLHAEGATALGLAEGTPVVGGFVDGSGAVLASGRLTPGTMAHTAGSTDVLAIVTDGPKPTDGLLCRPLGTGGRWLSVATQSAGGALIDWIDRTMYGGSGEAYDALDERTLHDVTEPRRLTFDIRLGGDRQSVQQPTGSLSGLTLGDTPGTILLAAADGLATDFRRRYVALKELQASTGPLLLTGGNAKLAAYLHSVLPGPPEVETVEQGTLLGLGDGAAGDGGRFR